MTPEEQAKIKTLLQNTGDAIAEVFDQMLKGNWEDDKEHSVEHNAAMIDLKQALIGIINYRTIELGYGKTPYSEEDSK